MIKGRQRAQDKARLRRQQCIYVIIHLHGLDGATCTVLAFTKWVVAIIEYIAKYDIEEPFYEHTVYCLLGLG